MQQVLVRATLADVPNQLFVVFLQVLADVEKALTLLFPEENGLVLVCLGSLDVLKLLPETF